MLFVGTTRCCELVVAGNSAENEAASAPDGLVGLAERVVGTIVGIERVLVA